MITAASPDTRVRLEIQKRFSTSSFPPVFYLFIDQTVYPRVQCRPRAPDASFLPAFLLEKLREQHQIPRAHGRTSVCFECGC